MKYSFLILLICLSVNSGDWTPLMAEGPTLRAGAAAANISPRTLPALQNGGFLQRTGDRVLDPLHARSLVLHDGKETIAIVIVDSCMFPTELCDNIKSLASDETGIPTDRILISATHTHSAPAAMMCLGCPADDAYVKDVAARVAKSIGDAHRRMRPAKLGWAIVDGADLTNCRRWITRSDQMGMDPFGGRTVRAMMHPGYQNPNYTSPAGPIDPWLSVLSVVSEKDDSPICVMANLSMHYFGGGAFSADYFGEAAQMLEARIGKESGKESTGLVGIMSQGTSGDLHWMDYSKPRRGISRKQYAQSVADRVWMAWKSIEHRSGHSLAMAEKRLTIARRIPSQRRREWARPINAARTDRPPRDRVEVYAQQAEWMHDNPEAEVVLQAVRIGELGITAIPNEVYGITGLKLKRQSPLEATFNLELANGATGYIPPPEQHRLGGYTTWPARTAGLVEEAEPLIVDTLLSLLEQVSERKRRTIIDPPSPYSDAVRKANPIAYWRLEEMNSTQVRDAVGRHPASFEGAVALFLPGPDGPGMATAGLATADLATAGYGNRSVYLAGGHLETKWDQAFDKYSVSMWSLNSLPAEIRDVAGVLICTDAETLSIAGKDAGDHSGKLRLRVGDQSFDGETRLTTKHWHQVTLTRDGERVRVYLDGRSEPEIDALVASASTTRLSMGSDGNADSTLDGKVDEVAWFDRALPAAEVAELYKVSGMTPPPRPKPVILLGPKPTDDPSRNRYAQAVLASEPVAFWRLHDEPDQAAKDSVGRSDARYEPGALPLSSGNTLPNFSGGRVNASVSGLGNTYSVEFWFRNELPVQTRPVTGYLFSRAVDGIEGAFGDNLGVGGTHSNMGKLIVFNGNQRNELVAGRTSIPVGGWSHAALVRQKQHVTVFLNGDPNPEISAALPVDYPVQCDRFLLGGRADNFANLQGMLEEVALYDRALTAKEAKAHFEAAGVSAIKTFGVLDRDAPNIPDDAVIGTSDEPTPTDAADAVGTIHVPDGFEVQLVAAEPLVMDPVAIDWGPDGKLWVVEMADYPLGVDGKGKAGGRVRFLEDSNDDGRFDKSTLFAEGLSFPTGVLSWGNGVLVTAAPQIVYLEDSSGDGKADIRRELFRGFLEGNQQLRVNGLRWGLDNWIYCASGSHHGGYGKDSEITSLLTGKGHAIGSRDFRIRPDDGEIDPQSGPSQYGRSRDDWGNWFGVQNSHPLWHYVLSDHHIRRNPHFAPPDPKHQVVTPANPRVYPASKLQKRYHSFSQSGRFTSACSPMIYRDELLFDRGAEQHALTCEPFHNLVQHNLIRDDGVSFRFRRDPSENATDFFASEDRWCRPVMARTGPDGAIWVVDMYRYMIEHPQWLPPNGKDELRPWYRTGDDRGRIYRIVRSDRPKRDSPRFDDLPDAELVSVLASPNGWQRDMAQRMLVRRKPSSAAGALRELAVNGKQPWARLHSLWTLDGLNALTAATLETALDDNHAGVRRNAVRIAADVIVNAEKLSALVDDPDTKVRLELACTLGNYEDPEASAALARLIIESGTDRYLLAAAMSSLHERNVSAVLRSAVDALAARDERVRSGSGIDSNLQQLIGQVIALGNKESFHQVIELICDEEQESPIEWTKEARFRIFASVLDRMRSREFSADVLSKGDRDRIAATIQDARSAVTDPAINAEVRLASVELLGREENRREEDFKTMQEILVPQSPSDLQRAIVSHLARRSEPTVANRLLAGWRSHSPGLRNQILETLANRGPWSESLREQLEAGNIVASELSAPVRQTLLQRNKNLPAWQKALAVTASADRAETLRRFQAALEMKGDSRRGAIVFRKSCINCHKLNEEGHDVGPQLASITNKTKEALWTSILDPSAAVDAKYFNYSIVTDDGRVVSGKLETETGSSITLLAAEGKSTTVLRREIEILQASTKSVMPEGLEQDWQPQDLADLLQFVGEAFRSRSANE